MYPDVVVGFRVFLFFVFCFFLVGVDFYSILLIFFLFFVVKRVFFSGQMTI